MGPPRFIVPLDSEQVVEAGSENTFYLPDISDPDFEDKGTLVMKCDTKAAKFVALKG